MFHVVLEEVPLHADVLDLLSNQGILGIRDGTLVVLSYRVCSSDGGVEDLPHKLAKLESLLGGVCRRVVLRLIGGLGDTCTLLGLVADGTAAKCKQVART
jgi:hypothetical protein